MRLSRKQKEVLLLWADSKHGALHVGSQDRRSVWVLQRLGLLEQGSNWWSSITAEGRRIAKELKNEGLN